MAISKVIYGDDTLIDITDSTIESDNMLQGTVGYDSAGVRTVGSYVDSDENVKQTNIDDSSWHTVVMSKTNNTDTETDSLEKSQGLKYVNNPIGTSSAAGTAHLAIGNDITTGNANNYKGKLRLYDYNDKRIDLYTTTLTGSRNITLPDKDGTVALTDDIPSATTSNPVDVATAASVGTSVDYARSDHKHKIALATGDNNGQVKVAGTNVSVKGLGTAAYTASTAYAVNKNLSNEDLDSITDVGFYYSGGGNTCANKPTGVDNFGLEVIHGAGGSYYVQIIYETHSNNTKTTSYRRYCRGGTWGSWVEDKFTDTNTTYTFAEGSTNGKFTVTPSDGSGAQSVTVHGLKSAAYTDSTAYKAVQTEKSSPTASGNTYQFIDTISQDTQGVITATKKSVQNVSTSANGLMLSTDKTKLNGISERSCVVGQSANTTSNPYFKFADISVDATYKDYTILFAVNDIYGPAKCCGILRVHMRINKDKKLDVTDSNSKTEMNWMTNGGYKLDEFLIAYPTTASPTVELWTKIPYAYRGRRFTVIGEGERNSTPYTQLFTLYNLYGTGQENPTSGYSILYSVGAEDLTFAYQRGVYSTDLAGEKSAAIVNNGSNLWIGAYGGSYLHHAGGTYISTGIAYDTSTSTYGNGYPNLKMSIPTRTESNGTVTWSHTQKNIAFMNATITSGRVLISDGTDGGIKSTAYTIEKSVPSSAVFTDRYVNSATFADDTSASVNSPVKMTLTRAGSDTSTVTANLPKVSSSSAGVVPKGAAVSSQSQTTKFLREDGTWSAPTYTTNTDTKVRQTLDESSDKDKPILLAYSDAGTTTANVDNISYRNNKFLFNLNKVKMTMKPSGGSWKNLVQNPTIHIAKDNVSSAMNLIGGDTKDGRIAINTYPSSSGTNNLCFDYWTDAQIAATSGNTPTGRMTWNGETNNLQLTKLNGHTVPTGTAGTIALTSDIPTIPGVVSTTADGLAPMVTSTTAYLRGDGTWATPSNNYDRNRYTGTITAGTAITAKNIIVARASDGKYVHLKTSKVAFDVKYPILYANADIASGSTGNNNYDVFAIAIATTQSLTLTAYKPVYIKGTLSGDTFTTLGTAPLTQTVPTSADGYAYMLLGIAYSTTNIYLSLDHRIFAYSTLNGFREIIPSVLDWNGPISITTSSSNRTNLSSYSDYHEFYFVATLDSSNKIYATMIIPMIDIKSLQNADRVFRSGWYQASTNGGELDITINAIASTGATQTWDIRAYGSARMNTASVSSPDIKMYYR